MLLSSFHRAVPRLHHLKHTQNIIRRNIKTDAGFKNYMAPRDRGPGDRLPLLIRPTIFVVSAGVSGVYLARYFSADQNPTGQRAPSSLVINGIILANVSVFALSQIAKRRDWRSINRFYQTYMRGNVFGRAPIMSMLGGMFNHMGGLHLVPNMLMLYSVANAIPTDTTTLLQVYFTGGLVATLASYTQTIFRPRFIGTTCGASGAILALLAYTAAMYPGTRLSIPGLDRLVPLDFSVNDVFTTLCMLDGFGAGFNSTFADHVAHLAGHLYGFLFGKNR